eukprot:6207805-Pleurochrysis_carterae.AAC.5
MIRMLTSFREESTPLFAAFRTGRRENASRLSVSAAPPAVLRLADDVTAVDALVYRSAIVRLLCDLEQLERAVGAQACA